jgi:hypothetical protein
MIPDLYRRLRRIPLFLFISVSCSTAVEPRSGVTLLVTNATCEAGRCDALRVLGFPGDQPNTPGGMWSLDLGLITGSQACLTLPPSATFRVIGASPDGTTTTTTYTWTTAKSLSLSALPSGDSRLQAGPSTAAFVPARAGGWTITVPGGSAVTPSSPCTSN